MERFVSGTLIVCRQPCVDARPDLGSRRLVDSDERALLWSEDGALRLWDLASAMVQAIGDEGSVRDALLPAGRPRAFVD